MANLTAKQYAKQGNVIFHPNFDRPAVVNPITRGKKKGCISFMTARRQKEAIKRRHDQIFSEITERLTGYICGLTGADLSQATAMASSAIGMLRKTSSEAT